MYNLINNGAHKMFYKAACTCSSSKPAAPCSPARLPTPQAPRCTANVQNLTTFVCLTDLTMHKNFSVALIFLIFTTSTSLLAQDKEINFDQAYRTRNEQQTTVEINELQELTYILTALTERGRKDHNMVNQKTAYHAEVLAHFAPYTEHKAVHTVQQLLTESIINYFILSVNAYGYVFEGNKIVPTGVYNFPAKGIGTFETKVNPMELHKKVLEDFAKESGYRAFYKEHLPYYNKLKEDFKTYGAIAEQKVWLEKRFDHHINSYRVLTSPLIGGMNATQTFEDNGFKEMLLFLPTIKYEKDWTEAYNKAINTRIIFTEIDHNYVRGVSNKNSETINKIFNDRDKWVDASNASTKHYPSPVKVFDEYLTWGLFILYAYDNYAQQDALLLEVIQNVNEMMLKKGFPKAKDFNEYLLKLYSANEEEKIEALYPALLEWSARQ